MRAIIGIIIAAGIAFCAYWFIGAHLFRKGVEQWFAAQAEAGRTAEVQGLEVTGFPLNFRVTSGTVAVLDGQSGWGWQTPSAAVTMPAWWPLRVNIALPPRQVLETPSGQVEIRADAARGQVRLTPSLAPAAADATTGALRATTSSGEVTANGVRFRSERGQGAQQHLTLKADGLTLTSGDLALTGGTLRTEASVTLAETVEDLPDAVAVPVKRIVLQQAELRFNDAALRLSGEVVADAEGYASGDLLLHVENWTVLLDTAVTAGLIPERQVDMLEGALRMMGRDGGVDLPLTLAGGMVRFGPLPVAPAPRLR